MPTWTKEVVDLSVAGSSLTIDDIKIDGTTIGHTDDTDLLTLTNGSLAIAGAVTGVTTLATSGNTTIGGDLTISGSKLTFGNASVIDNETASQLIFSGETSYEFKSTSGNNLKMFLTADAGEDNADKWRLNVNDGGDVKWFSYTSGSYVSKIDWDTSGNLTVAGDLTITGGNITSALTCDSTLASAGLLTASAGVKLGNNIIYASDGGTTITLDTSDNTTFTNDIVLANTKKLRLDGSTSGDTYIMQNGADVIDIVVGGDTMMKFTEAGNETIDISAEYVNFTGADTTFIPKLNLKNAADTTSPGVIQFTKTTRTGVDGDLIGRVISNALNDNDEDTTFAYMQMYITDASNGTEKGKIRFNVASGTDGGMDTVLTLEGTTTDAKPACQVGGYFSANGQTPAAAPDWTVSNKTTGDDPANRALDANGNIAAIGDNLAQLVDDLIAIGILQ
jgi:hypothetical protein